MATDKGYSSSEKDDRLAANHVTVEPIREKQHGLSVVAHMAVYSVGSDAVEASSTTSVINATAHAAKVGDVICFTSGTLDGQEVKVSAVSTNAITLAETLASAPANGVTFNILRHKYLKVASDGGLSVSGGTLQYVRDGVDTYVEEDTGTPANNRPLPVKLSGITGDINITANDLNVSLSHANDSIKIGDGTDFLSINGSGEALTHDADVRTELQTLNTVDFATEAKQDTQITVATAGNVLIGAVGETAPATDTASSGLNGRLQRIAQRITSLIALLPTSLGQKADADSLAVTLSTEQAAMLDGLETAIASTNTKLDAEAVLVGAVNETAPASDTANSGLNGRLQRIAQRLTSLIALLPTALGQGTMATSFKVVLPSDQSAIPVTQSGTWTNNSQLTTPTAKTVKSAQVTVGTSAVRCTTDGAAVTAGRVLLRLRPADANTGAVYIGASGVTTSTGILLYPGESTDFTFDAGEYYMISDTAAQTVHVLEQE
jgi:hypothetical protein